MVVFHCGNQWGLAFIGLGVEFGSFGQQGFSGNRASVFRRRYQRGETLFGSGVYIGALPQKSFNCVEFTFLYRAYQPGIDSAGLLE